MKRRSFVKISAVGTFALLLPIASCGSKTNLDKILSTPVSISHIMNSQIISEIGIAYRRLVPKESEKELLTSLLLENENINNPPKSPNELFIENLLIQNVKKDFIINNTITIDGWILSKTEARQCALYSLI